MKNCQICSLSGGYQVYFWQFYSLLSRCVFAVSLPNFEAFRHANVCLMRQFLWPVGLVLREDGGGGDGEPHACVSILFVCIHLGDTAAFIPKNSLCPPAWPFLSSDLYLRFRSIFPLIPRLLLCLSVLSFIPPRLHVTPVISFPVHPIWPL